MGSCSHLQYCPDWAGLGLSRRTCGCQQRSELAWDFFFFFECRRRHCRRLAHVGLRWASECSRVRGLAARFGRHAPRAGSCAAARPPWRWQSRPVLRLELVARTAIVGCPMGKTWHSLLALPLLSAQPPNFSSGSKPILRSMVTTEPFHEG